MLKSLVRWFPEIPEEFLYGEETPPCVGDSLESGLSHTLVRGDEERILQGQILQEAVHQGISAFNPDVLFGQLVHNYGFAEQLYGPKLLRLLTGEDPTTLRKQLRLPELQRILRSRMQEIFKELRKEGFVDKEYTIIDQGYELATLSLYMDELRILEAKGLGERLHQRRSHYGDKQDVRLYHAGDRYANLALRRSIHLALRRGHSSLLIEDLSVFDRESHGSVSVILALDASGSMKGKKIAACKRAGVALAYHALESRDRVGLVVFGKEISVAVPPTNDFSLFMRTLIHVRAKQETDIASTVRRAISLFGSDPATKHLILVTDAVPTVGEDPQQETLQVIAEAAFAGITTSVIAIGPVGEHVAFARHMVEIGGGRLGILSNLDDLDALILEEYAQL